MFKKILYVCLALCVTFVAVVIYDRFSAQNNFESKNETISVEVGDILFRSYFYGLANSKWYGKSGLPGHTAIVISEGEFTPDGDNYPEMMVIEARYFDRSTNEVTKQVSINKAPTNFGIKYKGRRFLLKSHLNDAQKEKLISYCKSQLGKPYLLLASKNDTAEVNCVTFARHAMIEAANFDIDANGGRVFFPNDIFKCPVYMEDTNRFHY